VEEDKNKSGSEMELNFSAMWIFIGGEREKRTKRMQAKYIRLPFCYHLVLFVP
jgi:hypothetical protein